MSMIGVQSMFLIVSYVCDKLLTNGDQAERVPSPRLVMPWSPRFSLCTLQAEITTRKQSHGVSISC